MNGNMPLSADEAAVLDAALPEGMTEPMRELAWYLFEALVRRSPPATRELRQHGLRDMAATVIAQMDNIASNLGGGAIYFAKGVAVALDARDRAMCAKFTGNNYRELAREYDLTEMRVRQIINAWLRERFEKCQGRLPGMDDKGGSSSL